jgi:hypothetical protein
MHGNDIATLRVAGIALMSRCRRPRSETVKRVSLLVLRSAARDPVFFATLRVARIALMTR